MCIAPTIFSLSQIVNSKQLMKISWLRELVDCRIKGWAASYLLSDQRPQNRSRRTGVAVFKNTHVGNAFRHNLPDHSTNTTSTVTPVFNSRIPHSSCRVEVAICTFTSSSTTMPVHSLIAQKGCPDEDGFVSPKDFTSAEEQIDWR
jgi:hypothetical protein